MIESDETNVTERPPSSHVNIERFTRNAEPGPPGPR